MSCQSYVSFILILFIILSVLGWVGAFSFRSNLLLCLLGLEFMTLGSFLLLMASGISPMTGFFFMVLSAIEASLGLSLVVLMSRKAGSDLICF